ncbi:2Fe-2S iron-sulfur cluster-binding protein [Dactylosporangium sp. McL0621]|uniref:2Fe-2S iron-sulfur cluster-binding protein n=1 Tax=Dactylosporangium sp. McL0621 TaxID=3415678 RepID=UPI003CF8FBCD
MNVVRFTFNGIEYTGRPGDTLAAALLANGVRRVATSVRLGRPRGIMSAGSEEPTGIVQVETPFPDPLRPATMVELFDGLAAVGLAGRGRLADRPDPARYDAVFAHCDVLVVGAGPAGLAAAEFAAAAGVRVLLCDEHPRDPALVPGATVLGRTTAFGYYDDNYVVAVERRTDHLGFAAPPDMARERIWRIRAKRVILATGAHERLIAFPGNDRPGVMLAGAARTYLHRFGVPAGRRAVVFTANRSGHEAAADLAAAGVEIAAVADAREGRLVTGTEGGSELAAVFVDGRRVEADLLLVSGGWSPVLHLYSQAGGGLRYDEDLGAYLADGCRQAVEPAGAAAGRYEHDACAADGAAAAARALIALGVPAESPPPVPAGRPDPPGSYLWHAGVAAAPHEAFVDLQRDVTVADVRRATGAGLRSVEHVKRYTTAGTAHDQGKTSGLLTSATIGDALGARIAELGVTTFRPPYTSVSFAALAGRDRGERFDPIRITAIHDRHVAGSARFENVGQWKRPWYYPRAGEDLGAAVHRECVAARTGVAMMDASTLGKIDVHGPDAAEFLDRMYTNVMSSLAVGAVRYGVMCRLDGMVFDDGTVARLAEDRFLVTTTTGNAAAVLDWFEEWRQTEWPGLEVWCTSVTEQWSTVAVVGPHSRAVLGTVGGDLADLPFMRWRDARVAGLAARVFRISFSGELAFEVNVPWWQGPELWEAVLAAGRPWGITPYGTETMHVLRAEKGYPIIGQDTDGTVTPHDLGLGWAVSKKKADFIGKRSFERPDTARPDRKHLVGVLPEDPALRLPEGAHLVADRELPPPPVPLLGHVTSSYHSAALGRTFALALVRSGRDRLGERLWVPLGDGAVVPVTVTAPVFYDPEGTRRDG